MNVLRATPVLVRQERELGGHLPLQDIARSWDQISDETGVPLNSDRAPSLGDDINFDYMQCPFSDSPSRSEEGRLISGLERERLRQSYADIRSYLLSARDSYQEIADPQRTRNMLVIDGINTLAFMQYLPVYLVNRANNPVPKEGSLPIHIVIGANAASGGIGGIGAYAQGELTKDLPTGRKVVEAAEKTGSLVGEKTVCVAKPTTISRFIDFLGDGSDIHPFSDIHTETKGLLDTEEFVKALVFGCRMEEINHRRTRLIELHQQFAVRTQGMAGSHNKLQSYQLMAAFCKAIRPLILESVIINDDLNTCLGRAPGADQQQAADEMLDYQVKELERINTIRPTAT